jgi:hypothetical protein
LVDKNKFNATYFTGGWGVAEGAPLAPDVVGA